MCDHEVGMGMHTYVKYCNVNGCMRPAVLMNHCMEHASELKAVVGDPKPKEKQPEAQSMSLKYPKYYKPVGNLKEVDVYAVCKLFPVADNTGCINHARKKLLVPGTRTGGKSFRDDIKEARDTLTRWLELNPE